MKKIVNRRAVFGLAPIAFCETQNVAIPALRGYVEARPAGRISPGTIPGSRRRKENTSERRKSCPANEVKKPVSTRESTTVKLIAKLAVSLALSIYLTLLIGQDAQWPRPYDSSRQNLFVFAAGSSNPLPDIDHNRHDFPMWFNRFGGDILAGCLWDKCRPFLGNCYHISAGFYYGAWLVYGGYFAAWYFATCVLFIIHLRDDCLIPIFGTFAGITYNLTMASLASFLPFDVSSMFWFTWAVLLAVKGDWRFLPLIIVMGSFFKETCAVTVLLFLGAEWSIRRRLGIIAGVGMLCVALRLVTTHLWGEKAFVGDFALWYNFRTFFHPHLNHFLVTNCGLVGLLWFLPLSRSVKLTCGAFLIGQLIYGHLDEVREYFELLPVGLIGLINLFRSARPL